MQIQAMSSAVDDGRIESWYLLFIDNNPQLSMSKIHGWKVVASVLPLKCTR